MLISIKDIYFSYKSNQNVINKLSLNVKANTIHCILGHNGAGKTTLFNLILGLQKCSKGSIIINKDFIDDKRDISMMPEFYGIYSELSIFENMRFRYQISKQSKNEMIKNIDALLKIFGINNRKNDIVKNLSQGLKKRTALAYSIIGNPKLLMLDEPTNAIDPSTYEILVKVLKHLKNKGVTILINSHDLNFVSKIADNITIINEGTDVYNGKLTNKKEIEDVYFTYVKNEEEIDYESF